MPMKPRKNESKNNFMQRCVSAETSAGYDQDQAIAICYSTWRKHKRKKDVDDGIIEY